MKRTPGSDQESGEDEQPNPDLARNFVALMKGRSVEKLRQDMAAAGIAVGTSSIQLARSGKGNTLAVTKKFAEYFGVSVGDLVGSPTAKGQAVSSAQFAPYVAKVRKSAAVLVSMLDGPQQEVLENLLNAILKNPDGVRFLDISQLVPLLSDNSDKGPKPFERNPVDGLAHIPLQDDTNAAPADPARDKPHAPADPLPDEARSTGSG